MDNTLLQISIPDGLDFSALKLARDSDGHVSFDWEPINIICAASNINPDVFTSTHEDNIGGLIMTWYRAHIANGGQPDPVAEDLIAEAMLEDEHGGGFSYPPGRA